jgi:hypothetical protein
MCMGCLLFASAGKWPVNHQVQGWLPGNLFGKPRKLQYGWETQHRIYIVSVQLSNVNVICYGNWELYNVTLNSRFRPPCHSSPHLPRHLLPAHPWRQWQPGTSGTFRNRNSSGPLDITAVYIDIYIYYNNYIYVCVHMYIYVIYIKRTFRIYVAYLTSMWPTNQKSTWGWGPQ